MFGRTVRKVPITSMSYCSCSSGRLESDQPRRGVLAHERSPERLGGRGKLSPRNPPMFRFRPMKRIQAARYRMRRFGQQNANAVRLLLKTSTEHHEA